MRRVMPWFACLLVYVFPLLAGCRTARGPDLDSPPTVSSSRKQETPRATDFAANRNSAEKANDPPAISTVAAPPAVAKGAVKQAFEPAPGDGPTLPAPEPLAKPEKEAAPREKAPPESELNAPPSSPKVLQPPVPQGPPVPIPPPPVTKSSAAPPPPGPLPPGLAVDPHQRLAPTAYGSVLQLPPGKTPIEKALELSDRLEACSGECKGLKQRIAALEEAVQARDRLMTKANRDFQDASADVARVRRELEVWAQDLKQQQTRLSQQDREHQEALRAMIQMLEKAVGRDGPLPSAKPPE